MANSKKPKVNVVGTVGAVSGVVATVATIIKEVVPLIPKPVAPSETTDNYILVPELCSKKFPLKLSEAKELLENSGLKPLATEVRLKDASSKYRDCFDFQVVASDHKANSKVRPGSTIVIKYVTQEIIDESQRLFETAEERKAAIKEERAVKRSEQMDKAKAVMSDVTTKAKSGVDNIIHRNGSKKDAQSKSIDKSTDE